MRPPQHFEIKEIALGHQQNFTTVDNNDGQNSSI